MASESDSRSNVTGRVLYSIDIHSDIAPEFLGRGRAFLNDIIEATGVRITPINEPYSNRMTLIMAGLPHQIDHAYMLITTREDMLIERLRRKADQGCPDMLRGDRCSRGRLCPYDHRAFRLWE